MDWSKDGASLKTLLAVLPVLAGFLILGYTVGMHVGRSGFAPSVVAALIPAVLTLVGGFIIFKSEDLHPVLGSFSVILFCAALLLGGKIGGSDLKKEIEDAREVHFSNCSIEEKEINDYRKFLELSPLPSEAFCGPWSGDG